MDYLDIKKERRHHVILFTGYICIAIGIVIASLILLYQAYGFGIAKQGKLIQNGLTFFSSQPNPADIYVDGKLNKVKTNSRLPLPEGIYDITLAREGYRDWKRKIEVDGGKVSHYDYPLLLPKQLTTQKVADYSAAPALSTQSPDKRWLVVSTPGSLVKFDLYDLKNPEEINATALTLPDGVLTAATDPANQNLQLVEWANDNRRVLLKHTFDGKAEYVLIDRSNPEQSLNLTNALGGLSGELTLRDKKYDQYYHYDQAAATLSTVTLENPAPVILQTRVLAYKTYGDDTLLYATDAGAPAGKVLVKHLKDSETVTLRSFPANTTYLLDLASYDGDTYMAMSAVSMDKVYVYKDPLGQLKADPKQALVPAQVFRVTQPNYLSFSSNTQYIMAQSGQQISVYDIENEAGFNYKLTQPIDAPQTHASWIDGNRLAFVTNQKLQIFDYDHTNKQVLVAQAAAYLPIFAPNFKYLYALAPNTNGQYQLTQTPLLIPNDL